MTRGICVRKSRLRELWSQLRPRLIRRGRPNSPASVRDRMREVLARAAWPVFVC